MVHMLEKLGHGKSLEDQVEVPGEESPPEIRAIWPCRHKPSDLI